MTPEEIKAFIERIPKERKIIHCDAIDWEPLKQLALDAFSVIESQAQEIEELRKDISNALGGLAKIALLAVREAQK